MQQEFVKDVKDSVFDAEKFDMLIEAYNKRDVREALLEMKASLSAQLIQREDEKGSKWYKGVKAMLIFTDRRLSYLNQILSGIPNEEGWSNLVLDLLDILDDHGLLPEASGLMTPNGEEVLVWSKTEI